MKKYTVEIVVALVVSLVIAIGVWSLTRVPASDMTRPQPLPGDRPVSSGPDMPPYVPPAGTKPAPGNEPVATLSIPATKSYQNGVYTLSGTLSLPTPCHELKTDTRIAESYPEQVTIEFTVVDTGAICVQVIDERPWSVQARVSSEATFRAVVNGQAAVFAFDEYAK